MIINELKLPFPIYRRRLRQNRFRENCAGAMGWRLIMPKNAFLPFQFRVEGLEYAPTVAQWKLNRVCPQFVTTVVNGEFSQEFEDSQFPVQEQGSTTEIPSTLVITYDNLLDGLGDPLLDGNGDPILTGEVSISGETANLGGIIASHLEVVTMGNGFNIIYKGQPFDFALPCGYYEMFFKLSNGMSFWSEVFQVVEFPVHQMPYMALTWYNDRNLEKICYETGYQSRIYLDSFIANSEPVLTETVKADGLGVEVPVSVVVTDKFVVSEVVPDYMKNALSTAPVCVHMLIDDPKTEVSFAATRTRVSTSPEEGGCFSFVEFQFEVDNETFRTGC